MDSAVTTPSTSTVPTQPVRLCGGLRMRGTLARGAPGQPLVSVITASFNARKHIADCIQSVQLQDYRNIEHIIIDGGSIDGTVDVLRSFDKIIALWRSEPDKGIYDAWNKGLVEARGEWICFIGADDELLPGAISAYMRLAAEYPEAEYLSSRIRYVHSSGYVNPAHGKPWSWPRFSRSMCVAHPGSMHRRSLYERLGEYDISYRTAADYELLLRAGAALRAAFMPAVTATMRGGGASDRAIALKEAYRARVITGQRNRLLARVELWKELVKFRLLPLRRAVAVWMEP